MPRASESSVPLALLMVTVQYSGPLSLSSLDLQGPDLWDRDCRVSRVFRAGSLSKDRFLQVSSSLGHNQCPLMLAGQSFLKLLHLGTCDGGVHRCIAFLAFVMVEHIVCVSLLATLLKLYIRWC